MSLNHSRQTDLCDAIVERTVERTVELIVAAIDGDADAGGWPADRAWLGNLVEHTRATLSRTIAQSLAEEAIATGLRDDLVEPSIDINVQLLAFVCTLCFRIC